MAEIISDGVRSVTSDDTSSANNGYGGFGGNYGGFGGGYGYNNGMNDHFWQSQAETVEAVTVRGVSNELATEKVGAAGILATNVVSAQLNVQAEKIGAATNLAIEKTHAASNLLAVQNAAAAAAALAACCCELKEKIAEDGSKTRDLVSSINAANLAIQLADAKQALLVANTRLLPGAPVVI